MRRRADALKSGDLLPLEWRVLEIAQELEVRGDTIHGYGLLAVLWQRAGDAIRATPSSVYRALRRLETAGLLKSSWEDPELAHGEARPQRRTYNLTGAAVALLARREVATGPSLALVPSRS